MAPRSQVYQSQLTVPVLQTPTVQRVDVSSGLEAAAHEMRKREGRHLNEMRLEAATKLQELQATADTVPFDQRKAFFDQGAQKLREDFDKRFGFLDIDLRGNFHQEWGQMFAVKGIEVKESARRGEADHNVATMEGVIAQLEGQAARASTPQERAFFVSQIGATLSDALATGAIDETKAGATGRESLRRVDKNIVNAMIEDPNQGPNEALRQLAANRFMNLREEDRLAAIERAERKLQHTASMNDHALVVSERKRKLLGEQVAKEGFDLLAKGQLTDAWLTQNEAFLDTSDYRMIRNGMQEGGSPMSADVQARLYREIYVEGKDASEDIIAAMNLGHINGSQAKALLNENQGATPAKRGKTFITQYLKPSDINPTPAAAQQYAEAIAEFDRMMANDPKQDPLDLARKVVERNSIVQFDGMTAVMPLPDYAVGGRRAFDEKATRAATTRAFMVRHGNSREKVLADPAFKVEVRKIDAWAAAKRKLDAAQQATGKGTK